MKTDTSISAKVYIMQPAKWGYFLLAFIIGIFIVIKSIEYWSPQFAHGFLSDKEEFFFYYRFFLYTHMLAGPVALFAGLFQFTWRRHRLHSWIGRIYIVSILVFAAPAGFAMAWYAADGFWSVSNFLLLSLLWFYFTLKAFQKARLRQFEAHQNWMIRSFILTNSAVLLRVFSYFSNHWHLMEPVTGYLIIGWLSWLPFLLIFEILLFFQTKT